MRRLLAGLSVIALAVALAGCGPRHDVYTLHREKFKDGTVVHCVKIAHPVGDSQVHTHYICDFNRRRGKG
jgi:hypothetical protein